MCHPSVFVDFDLPYVKCLAKTVGLLYNDIAHFTVTWTAKTSRFDDWAERLGSANQRKAVEYGRRLHYECCRRCRCILCVQRRSCHLAQAAPALSSLRLTLANHVVEDGCEPVLFGFHKAFTSKVNFSSQTFYVSFSQIHQGTRRDRSAFQVLAGYQRY